MSGTAAGIVSILSLVVGVALVTTLVKNPQGTTGLINSSFTGFANILSAAQGNPVYGAG